jgi:hypothetical protein
MEPKINIFMTQVELLLILTGLMDSPTRSLQPE